MKRISRDRLLALGLLALLVVIIIAAAVRQSRHDILYPPLTSLSDTPDGASALRRWLEQIGYSVGSDTGQAFSIPASAKVALILEPYDIVSSTEWLLIEEWIKKGGTLLVAGEEWGGYRALGHYQYGVNVLPDKLPPALSQTPLANSVPWAPLTHLKESNYLVTDQREEALPLLAKGQYPLAVTFRQGKGRVILVSVIYPFTNAGLKETGNPELVLNLLGMAGPNPQVWLDDWHHGVRPNRQEIVGPEMWLRYTPAGRALLFVGVVIFIALLLQGRNFGRALEPVRQLQRRSPLEHITAIANLSRRAGHRAFALGQYHHAVKRHLARRYRLNPTLPDEQYLVELARCNPDLDITALATLLKRLRRPNPSETDLVKLAAEAADWMQEK